MIHLPGEIIGAGTNVVNTAGDTIAGVAHEAGSAVGNVAHEAGGAITNVAGAAPAMDIFSSPLLLIGGAAVLLIALSK